MAVSLHMLWTLMLLHCIVAKLSQPHPDNRETMRVVDSENCDESTLSRQLSESNVAAIHSAVRQFSDPVPILIASAGKAAGCHLENFLMHAAAVAETEGMPSILHAALLKSEHKQCLKVAKHQRISASTLTIRCVYLEGWLPSGLAEKFPRRGHGSCFYRHAVWVKPRLLQAVAAVASEGVIWMDLDVLPFRNLATWLTRSRQVWKDVGFMCSAVEVYNQRISETDGKLCNVTMCNTGQLFVAAGDKTKDLLEQWAQLGPRAPAKSVSSWGDQQALRTIRHQAWCLPKSDFGSCGEKSITDYSVHHCISSICPEGPFRLSSDAIFDDRAKIPAMVASKRWYPLSKHCKDVEKLVAELQNGWETSKLLHTKDNEPLDKEPPEVSENKRSHMKTEDLEELVLDQFRSVKPDLDFQHGVRSTAIRIKNWATGWSMERVDVELFQRLAQLYDPRHIFIIGNGFGYSAIAMANIFQSALVDVIEAGVEGSDALEALELTKRVARSAGLDVSLYRGYSPQDTPEAVRRPSHRESDESGGWYELAFIDGEHENEQVVADFNGLQPWLAERVVVVFHDVRGTQLEWAVRECLCADEAFRFVFYQEKKQRKSFTGTGFMYKGFPDKAFRSFRTEEGIHKCKSPKIGIDLLEHHESVEFGISVKSQSKSSRGSLDDQQKRPGKNGNALGKSGKKAKAEQKRTPREKSKDDIKRKDRSEPRKEQGKRKRPSSRFDISSFEEAKEQRSSKGILQQPLQWYNENAMRIYQEGQPRKAEELLREGLQKHGSEAKQNLLLTEFNLAVVLYSMRRVEEAEEKMRQVYQDQRKHFGDHHEDTEATKSTLITILQNSGRHEEAAFLKKPVVRRFQLEHATHHEL